MKKRFKIHNRKNKSLLNKNFSSKFDFLGSYTGSGIGSLQPEQDADDL